MSTTIDEKVVEMRFDNKQFESNVSTSMSTLDKLKQKLNFKGFTDGLDELSTSASKVNFSPMEEALNTLTDRFSFGTEAIHTAWATLVSRLTNSTITAAKNMVNALTFDQISAGWDKYADKTSSVQTIMAATGQTIEEVSEQLERLNWFTDETSYDFVDMTNNIGKFTSQGQSLDNSVRAMEGIATWAAISGANASEASRAMYNVSQSLGNGYFQLIDWKSIENANMATKEFKELVLETAADMGTLKKVSDGVYETTAKQTEVTYKSFSKNLSEGWFTTDVIMEALQKYGGFADELNTACEKTGLTATEMLEHITDYKNGVIDLDSVATDTGISTKELKTIFDGLSSSTFELGEKAFRAAQEAKTFQDAINATKDAVSTGWLNIYETIFGNYEQAKELWTSLANTLYDVFASKLSDVNDVLKRALRGQNDTLSETLTRAGIDVDTFQKKVTELAAKHNVDLDSMIEQEGTFGAALKKCFSDGTLDTSILKDALGELINGLTETSEVTKDLSNVIDQVISGKFGTGEERIKALTEAGYNWAEVQNGVNEKLGSSVRHFVEVAEAQGQTVESLSELTDEQLKALGYTDDEIEALKELKKMMASSGDTLNDLLGEMDKMTGAELLFGSISNIFESISAAISAVGKAWRRVMYGDLRDNDVIKKKADNLYNLLNAFYDLTEKMKISDETASKITRTFEGLFNAISLVASVIKGGFTLALDGVKYILDKFHIDISEIVASIGDMFTKFKNFVTESEAIQNALSTLKQVFKDGVDAIAEWVGAFAQTVDIPGTFESTISQIGGAFLKVTQYANEGIKGIGEWILAFAKSDQANEHLRKVATLLEGTCENINKFLGNSGKSIKEFFESIGKAELKTLSFENFSKSVQTFLTSMFNNIVNAFVTGGESLDKVSTDLLISVVNSFTTIGNKINEVINRILDGFNNFDLGAEKLKGKTKVTVGTIEIETDRLYEIFSNFFKMVDSLKNTFLANIGTIFTVGYSIAIMKFVKATGESLTNLATTIDKTFKTITAPIEGFSTGFKTMTTSVGKYFDALTARIKSEQMGRAFLRFAAAIAILAGSIFLLAQIEDTDKLKAAVYAIVGLMAAMAGIMAVMTALDKTPTEGANKSALAMVAMAGSLIILATALKTMDSLDETKVVDHLKTIGILTVGMVAVAVALSKWAPNISTNALALVAFAAGLKILVSVLQDINDLQIENASQVVAVLLSTVIALGALALACNGLKWTSGVAAIALVLALKIFVDSLNDVIEVSKNITASSILVLVGIMAAFGYLMLATKVAGIYAASAGIGLVAIAAAMMLFAADIKIFGALDKGEIKRATSALAGITAIFSGVIMVSRFAGKYAARAGVMIALMSGAILILAGAILILAHIPEDGLARATLAVLALEGMFAVVIAASYFAKDVNKQIITITTAIAVLAGAIAALAIIGNYNPEGLTRATIALSTVLGMFALIIAATSLVKEANATLVLLAVIVAALAGVLIYMSSMPNADEVLPVAAGISAVLLSLSVSMGILGLMSKSVDLKGAIASVVGVIAMLAAVAIALSCLSGLDDIDAMSQVADKLTVLLLTLSASMLVLSAASALANPYGMITVILGMIAVLATISALALSLYELDKLCTEDLSGALDRGLDLLKKICTGLGECIGGFAAGLVSGFVEGMVGVAENLQIFAEKLSGITLKEGTAETVTSLIGLMVLLSGAEFLDSLLNTGDIFGRNATQNTFKPLLEFGDAMVEFSAKMSNIDPMFVTMCAIAGQALVTLYDALPREGGVINDIVGFFGGERMDMETFGSQLEELGNGIKKFSDAVSKDGGLDTGAVEASIPLVTLLSDMAEKLPNSGGLLDLITGSNDMDDFATGLGKFGEALVGYSTNVKDLDADAVNKSVAPVENLAKMAEAIPNSGGLLADLVGDNDMATFANGLSQFGYGLKAYGRAVDGLNVDAILASTPCGEALAALASEMPLTGGVVGMILGNVNMTDFANGLYMFGWGMKAYSNAISSGDGLDTKLIDDSATAAGAVLEMAENFPRDGGIIGDFLTSLFGEKMTGESFKTMMSDFGGGMVAFSESVSSITDFDVVKNASIAGAAMAELGTILWDGGTVKKLISSLKKYDIASLKENLPIVGGAMVAYSNSLKGINSATVTNSETCASVLSSVMHAFYGDQWNNTSKILDFYINTDLNKFPDNAAKMGTALKNFYDGLGGTSIDSIQSVITASVNPGASIASLANSFTKEVDGTTAYDFYTKGDFSAFTDNIVAFGAALSGYSDAVKNVDSKQVGDSVAAGESLAAMLATILGTQIENISIDAGKSILTGLASGIDVEKETPGTSLTSIADSLLAIITNKQPAFQTAGSDLIKNLAEGIKSQDPSARISIVDIMTSCITRINDQALRFQTAGSNRIGDIITGFNSKLEDITTAIDSLVSTCITELTSEATKEKFYKVGEFFVEGLVEGIEDNIEKVREAAREMADAAEEAAQIATDEHSPSKKARRIGAFFGLGFVNGIRDYADKAYSVSEEMAENANSGLGNAISKVRDAIDSNIDTQPTIRPVLDLSDVEEKSLTLGTILSSSQAVRIGASMDAAKLASVQNGDISTSSGNLFNFTQNNYSPKALSRIEIYRQTKNQFSAMGRMVEA